MDLLLFTYNIVFNNLLTKNECPICQNIRILTNYPCNKNHVICYDCIKNNEYCYYICNQPYSIEDYEIDMVDLFIILTILLIKT